MTQSEFLEKAAWTKFDVWKFCEEITTKYGHLAAVNYLMGFRKDFQQALSKYAGEVKHLNGYQMNAVQINRMIEKWCGQYYKQWAMQEILKKTPDMVHRTQKLKGLTNNAWEQFVQKHSY